MNKDHVYASVTDRAQLGVGGAAPLLPEPELPAYGVKEANFPGYNTPAGAVPGQRTGFVHKQLDQVERVRAFRRDAVALLHDIGGTTGGQNSRFGSADLTLALRHIQDAEYRIVRHITGGPND